MATLVSKLEMEFDGFGNGWTDVSDDLRRSEGVRFSRGLPGNTPKDLVAKTGVFGFFLDNSEGNSEGLLGLYSPGHANCRAGFDRNIGVRLSYTVNGSDIVVFTGRMDSISPTTGLHERRLVECFAVDYMNEFSKKRLNNLEIQVDIAEHDAFQMIVDTMPLQPRALEITDGLDTIPYMFDTVKDERSAPMNETQKLCQSTLARVYVQKNGTLTYEPRGIRAVNISNNVVELTASDIPADSVTQDALKVIDARGKRFNKFVATLHPRTVGTVPDVVLFAIESPIEVAANSSFGVRGTYTDPAQDARRAGGLDMLPAVAGTDYEFNTEADGSGLDVTADVTVTTEFTANSVLFLIDAPVNCWAITLQARGTMVKALSNISVQAEDEDDIADYGEIGFTLDMPYTVDPVYANEVVQYFLYISQQNTRRAESHKMLLNGLTDERAALMLNRDISDRIGVTEVMTVLPLAVRSGFYIQAVSMEEDGEGRVWLTWDFAPSDATSYWYLEIPGKTEMGFTTILGFGLVIGHTDIAHEDTHGDSAHVDTAHDDTHGDVAHEDAAHSDSAHTDTAHSDVAHSDVSHADTHADSAHSDVSHDDSHSDVAHVDSHGDVAHQDQAHGDVPFQGYTNTHDDNHNDTAHNDYHFDSPEDPPIPHSDEHGDVVHVDEHFDSHIDDGGNPHVDDAHLDGAHTDSHADGAHSDTHNDTAHVDAAHGDSHGDVAHTDVAHSDTHGDTGHGDAAHADTSHTDTHTDVAHGDTAHSDEHEDSPHGDAN
jgi:hypothetical protein